MKPQFCAKISCPITDPQNKTTINCASTPYKATKPVKKCIYCFLHAVDPIMDMWNYMIYTVY